MINQGNFCVYRDVQPTAGDDYNPQVPPVLQEDELLLELNENEPPPEIFDANVDTFFLTAFD